MSIVSFEKKWKGGANGAKSLDRLTEESTMRLPPHNIEAEQSVLGAIIIDMYGEHNAFHTANEILAEADFYRRDHQVIFRAIQRLKAEDKAVDAITLADFLEKANMLEQCGGLYYVGSLAKNTPSAANTKTYCEIVKEAAQRRKIIALSQEATSAVFDEGSRTPEMIAAQMATKINDLETSREKKTFQLGELVDKNLAKIESIANGEKPPYIDTGLRALNAIHDGHGFPYEFIVLGGRPSHGKTTLALQIAVNAALSGVGVAVFQLELTPENTSQRILANLAGVTKKAMDAGDVNDQAWRFLGEGTLKAKSISFTITNAAGFTISQIIQGIRRQHASGARFFVVDHARLVVGDTRAQQENDNKRAGDLTNALFSLKNKLGDSCFLLLSPVRKEVDTRPDRRPQMGDIYGSGDVTSDADIVLICYRDELYHPDSPDRGTTEILVRKNRNGEIPLVTPRLKNRLETYRFADMDYYHD